MRIVVVGAGVTGLTCAYRLVEAGHEVEIWSRDAPGAGVSSVAAAHWYPYRAFPLDAVDRWSRATFEVFAELADQQGTGVGMRAGRQLSRTPLPARSWATSVPGMRHLTPAELPAGYADAYHLTVPVIRMPDYLPWLVGELAAAGVTVLRRELTDIDTARAAADLVVNATGLDARTLVHDTELTPVRGQVVRVSCPGLDEWTLDEGHPDGMVYVIPRGPDVICGGTADEGAEDMTPDPATAAAILRRARQVVPELAAAVVLDHAVGLRPGRTAVRLERVDDVVHCYGHGGSGVALSWGCAADVVQLVEAGHLAPPEPGRISG